MTTGASWESSHPAPAAAHARPTVGGSRASTRLPDNVWPSSQRARIGVTLAASPQRNPPPDRPPLGPLGRKPGQTGGEQYDGEKRGRRGERRHRPADQALNPKGRAGRLRFPDGGLGDRARLHASAVASSTATRAASPAAAASS